MIANMLIDDYMPKGRPYRNTKLNISVVIGYKIVLKILRCITFISNPKRPILALLLIVTFLCYKSNSYKFNIHLPYTLESPEVNEFMRLAGKYRGIAHALKESDDPKLKSRECSGNELGPFMVLSTPLNGISNQFHYLHDILTILYGFEGTIVFPRYSSSRLPIRKNETWHKWVLTPIENHFDVVSIIDRLRNDLGMKICLESTELRKKSAGKTVPFLYSLQRIIRVCMNNVGCAGNMINKFMKTHFDAETFIVVPNIWGAVPIPHTVQTYTPMLQLSINISSALHFAPNVEELGKKLFDELMQIVHTMNETRLNVVHLRIEQDYKAHMNIAHGSRNSTTDKLLKPYADFFKLGTEEGLYYFAVGNLFPDEKAILSAWANKTFGHRWILKESLSVTKQLGHLNTEQLAIVELFVIVNANSFIGNGASSFSYIASEKRDHLGLPSWLVLPPAEIYYPILGTRRHIWSKMPSLKLTN